MRLMPHLASQVDVNGRLPDPFSLFYQFNARLAQVDESQNAWTPYEELGAAVLITASMIIQPIEVPERQDREELVWEKLIAPRAQSSTSWVFGFVLSASIIKN
ncbi:hypothetical protein QAD02_001646 [Eretmocerus hayati]|uniref:Uncharacterized protein n=1 Tax=Eretmocerus hayati TaxID=131215 RepID=A0ACC2NH09_9HYME|nr:hypothetical protein QAD02_001646 [Eretmocerus hayati]